MSGIDLSGVSVAIIMVVRDERDTTVPTMHSMITTLEALHAFGVSYETQIYTGGMLTSSRSYTVKKFLQTKYTHAFFVDSDIAWKPDDFMKVLAYATIYEVIGAGYRHKSDPAFYLVNVEADGVRADKRGCIPVTGMGLGFTCVQRHILEKLSAKARLIKNVQYKDLFPEVFRFDEVNGEARGEDMAFLADVRDLGYTPMMDPSIELGHLGNKLFSGRFADIIIPAAIAAE